MRKTSVFARKRKAQGFSTAADVLSITHFMRPKKVLLSSEPYSAESNRADGEAIIVNHRKLLQLLLDHQVSAGDAEPHDAMSHVIGVAQIRILEIGGPGANDVMKRLNLAADGLIRTRARWERTQKWGLDMDAREALKDAMEIYEAVLLESSPKQMQIAQDMRLIKLAQMEKAA